MVHIKPTILLLNRLSFERNPLLIYNYYFLSFLCWTMCNLNEKKSIKTLFQINKLFDNFADWFSFMSNGILCTFQFLLLFGMHNTQRTRLRLSCGHVRKTHLIMSAFFVRLMLATASPYTEYNTFGLSLSLSVCAGTTNATHCLWFLSAYRRVSGNTNTIDTNTQTHMHTSTHIHRSTPYSWRARCTCEFMWTHIYMSMLTLALRIILKFKYMYSIYESTKTFSRLYFGNRIRAADEKRNDIVEHLTQKKKMVIQ